MKFEQTWHTSLKHQKWIREEAQLKHPHNDDDVEKKNVIFLLLLPRFLDFFKGPATWSSFPVSGASVREKGSAVSTSNTGLTTFLRRGVTSLVLLRSFVKYERPFGSMAAINAENQ